ncbi:uncharacterized protein LOC119314256 [Triticum dicoccoides]|uniref:uncharacterized protein LOC119314256 n=1 Tax=Triticum dicoccoides TaxID=85692 RepID=UPI0018910DA2|nr:uncharacterized protein LOC119314256 [Triticum dicoccoides]
MSHCPPPRLSSPVEEAQQGLPSSSDRRARSRTRDAPSAMDAKRTAVGRASVTALVTACVTVVAYALATAAEYALDRYHLCSQASFLLRCVSVTAAAAAEWRALWLAMLCCTVLEAAVAALALRLPCRRRALACLQLEVTMVRHCMCARAFLLPLAADPEYLVGTICIGFTFCFAANDVANFVHFLRGGDN